jgi:2-polyprenyl-6-hydroxyphenyl methylase/3-demethylubiquinone-9 3-methyltransferase
MDIKNRTAVVDSRSDAAQLDDRNSDPAFVGYYERESVSARTAERFRVVRDKMLRLGTEKSGRTNERLSVLDVGCGAGTECQVWAELGHSVTGIDISEPLVRLARKRASEQGFDIHFDVGSAQALPYAANTFDVCLIPQLLEHVPDWQKCLDEGTRILRPGGLLYLSTTNVLCPIQNEFELPLYSWYPKFVKRRCERLAVTTHREWVSHTSYPAVHWFTFWQLKEFLAKKGLECFDRFDLARGDRTSAIRQMAFALIRRLPPLRVAAYLLVAGTIVVGVKTPDIAPVR